MSSTSADNLAPRFAEGSEMRVIGLTVRYTEEKLGDIPRQWGRFSARLGEVRQRTDPATFGLCYPADEGRFALDYVTGVMVADGAPLPDGFVERRIPARRHAVFTHHGHVAGLRAFTHRIFHDWLLQSGHRAAGRPLFTEVYGEDFDAEAAEGVVEIWVPLTD